MTENPAQDRELLKVLADEVKKIQLLAEFQRKTENMERWPMMNEGTYQETSPGVWQKQTSWNI